MRLLIWGIVGLSGLGLIVQLVGIHGATDEQAVISRAVRAPFLDLRRRDARALCEDFTPAVAAHLTVPAGDCQTQVRRLFKRSEDHAEYVPAQDSASRGRLRVTAVHWRAGRATAASVGPGRQGPMRHWRLELVHGRWRIATPATLQVRSDCKGHPFGESSCLDALSMRFAGA